MNALLSIDYPYWLMIAGALLLLLGLIGIALRHRSVEAEPTSSVDEPSHHEAELTPAELYNRAAKEKRKARWAETTDETMMDAEPKPQQMT